MPDRVPTWVPDRVPIRGPEGARKRKEITKWNRAKDVPPPALLLTTCIHACPEGAII